MFSPLLLTVFIFSHLSCLGCCIADFPLLSDGLNSATSLLLTPLSGTSLSAGGRTWEESCWCSFKLLEFLYDNSNMNGCGYLFWFDEMAIFLINSLLLCYPIKKKQTAIAAASNQERYRTALKTSHSLINIPNDHTTKTGKTAVHCVRAKVNMETGDKREEWRRC